ncbi:MAG: very short patch repair endonuclease [bacterium]
MQPLAKPSRRGHTHNSYPTFKGLKPASPISSRSKQANASKGTRHELLLMKELKRLGLKFKRYMKDLPGKPDIVFPEERVAVFCDGDFWHGKNWRTLCRKLTNGTNGKYWKSKIACNIKQDKRITKILSLQGWNVIRLWETDIKANTQASVQNIKREILWAKLN